MNALNRLTQDILTDLKTPANSKTTAYAYGNTGNRTTKTETQGTTVTTTGYAYDADDRLTSETKTTGTAVSTTTYQWDANGNLTQKVEPTQTTLYLWDSNNRLVEVKRGTSAATALSVATYQYDAQGNRVSKTLADGTKISYLVDSNMSYAQVAEETSTSTTTTSTTDYLYGLERIQQTRAGQGTFYLDDGLGSTRLLTDQNGNVTDSYDYDDYGALQTQTGTTKNDFLFAGEQFDSEAGLHYNRARYLDVNVGRFTGLDSYAGNRFNPITLNKYNYASADPVNKTDPSGRMTTLDTGAASNIAVTLSSIEVIYGVNFLNSALNSDSSGNSLLLGIASLGAVPAFQIYRKLSTVFRQRNLPQVDSIDMAHITGNYIPSNKNDIKGYHSRPGNVDAPGWGIANIEGPNAHGIYLADVSYSLNGIEGGKKGNKGKSTFFPDYWDYERVEAEILTAYMNSYGADAKGNWEGISASGKKIQGFFRNGKITSAFPAWP